MFAMPATTTKPYDERKARTKARNQAVRLFIDKMYKEKRRRFDDCIQAAAKEFHLSELSITRIYQEG
jgi:hypothetical protein